MNVIIIKGRLTRDPEIKEVQGKNGAISVCKFSVAVNNPTDDETTFFNCEIWGKSAEALNKFVTKGQEIAVEGSMVSRPFTDKEGNKRTSWDLKASRFHFCGNKSDKPVSEPVPDGFVVDESDIPF